MFLGEEKEKGKKDFFFNFIMDHEEGNIIEVYQR